MGLRESLRELKAQEDAQKKLSVKREVKKELTKLRNEKVREKKCVMCDDAAHYAIKGSRDWYCKDCAKEFFGSLSHLKRA